MRRKSSRALHRKPSRERMVYAAMALAVPALVAGMIESPAAVASTGTVTGSVWDDADRDGLQDVGETGFGGLAVYVFSATTGGLVASAATDNSGRFSVPVADGGYQVTIAGGSWSPLANNWTPTTTGSLQPSRNVTVAGNNVDADIGLRQIVRSGTDPISTYKGPSGLVVESYDDVVPARLVHDELAATLLGGEAVTTKVRFDLDTTNHTSYSWGGSPGSYYGYSATVYSSFRTWLDDGGASLTHEYGHAWSMYQAAIMQQDETLAAYLRARGLAGDPRLGSDVFWQPREMVAEDYRQLFGSTAAASRPQANRSIPPAADVPGLREWMRDTFTTAPPAPAPEPAPAPAPSPSPSPSPSPGLTVTGLAMNPLPVVTSGTASAQLSTAASVTLVLFDSRGRAVRTLLKSAAVDAGTLSVPWDRRDDRGRLVKSGTYGLTLKAVDARGASVSGSVSVRVG